MAKSLISYAVTYLALFGAGCSREANNSVKTTKSDPAEMKQAIENPAARGDAAKEKKRDLNPPVTINTKIGDPSKKTVLVYYTNETAPNEAEAKNYETLIGWLRSSDDKEVHKIADRYERDLTKFPEAVDTAIASLKKNILGKEQPVGATIFTNRLSRQGKYLVLESGAENAVEKKFDVPKVPDHWLFKSNPNVLANTLQAALLATAQQFDPDTHQFVLITKSHGGAGRALIVLNNVDAGRISKKAYLASAIKSALRMSKMFSPPGELGIDPQGELGIDPQGELGAGGRIGLGPDDEIVLGGEKARIGMTKKEYLGVLNAVGAETGMTFPLLFVESCQSYFDAVSVARQKKLGSNIGRMYTSDLTGLKYNTLDFDAVFAEAKDVRSFADALHRVLYRQYEIQKAARENDG